MRLHILFIICSCIAPLSYGCNQLDRQALLSISLKFSLSPSRPLNWYSNPDCCLWEGITCNRQGHVARLWLPSRVIEGSISPSLQNITHLSHLNLSHNHLSGPLLDTLFTSLHNLSEVDLSFNLLSGILPLSFPLPPSIRTVDFSSNNFFGEIQASALEFATNLVNFNVNNNELVGQIPLPRCNLQTTIKLLDFSSNKFNGQIPPSLGRCSKLEIFRAGFNSFSGSLPSAIYNLTLLTEFSIPWNFLSGTIEAGLGQLSDLTLLELYGNGFTGSIPWNIGELSNLEILLLDNNYFAGSLPSSLMNCTKLTTLNLRTNMLEGDLMHSNFTKLDLLQVLDLGNNNFSKNFPKSIYSCKSLRALRLSSNPIDMHISSGILALESLSYLGLSNMTITNISRALRVLASCKSLQVLVLSKNFYNETLPYDFEEREFNGFNKIQALGLGGCNIKGQIPFWLSKLTSLKVIDLSFNQLTGTIPSWLGNMPNLFYIDFSHNFLSRGVPQELATLASLSSYSNVDPSSYMELPLFLMNVNRLQYNRLSYLVRGIYLGNNMLTGFIPLEIGHMKYLQVLDLSSNHFSGTIPNQISNLTNLEVLDLSNNRLSGEIPISLRGLHFLSLFNVSNNNLQGSIPQGGQFDTFSESAFMGNPKLCGSLIGQRCKESNSSGNADEQGTFEQSEDELFWVHFLAIIGFFLGFWVVCGPLIYYEAWRNDFFQFLDETKDKIYVIVVVYISRLWRLIH